MFVQISLAILKDNSDRDWVFNSKSDRLRRYRSPPVGYIQQERLMESPKNSDIDQKLQEIEASLDRESVGKIYSVEKASENRSSDRLLSEIKTWYGGLSSNTKILVWLGGGIGGLIVIGTVLRLVSNLFTLAILAGGAYLVYKFWIKPKQEI
jgi:hypothetical protein